MNTLRFYWQFWTVRMQAVIGFLGGLLAVWNMMPSQVRTLLPDQAETILGCLIFVCAVIASRLRGRREPKP